MQKWVSRFRDIFDSDNYHPIQVYKVSMFIYSGTTHEPFDRFISNFDLEDSLEPQECQLSLKNIG